MMFVSRKDLTFIHLIPRELAPSIGVLEFLKQCSDFRSGYLAGAIPVQPIAECVVQRFVLAASDLAGQFNLVLIRTKRDVLHLGLSLIHLVARELATCIGVAQIIHQRSILPRSNRARDPCQPVAEKFIERGVLTLRFLSGKLDVGLLGIEDNILSHENSVHHFSVYKQDPNSYPLYLVFSLFIICAIFF